MVFEAAWASRTRAEAERLLRSAITEIRRDRPFGMQALQVAKCGVLEGFEDMTGAIGFL